MSWDTKDVPEFCTCGAQLPPDARFCHKCGKPQYDYPNLELAEEVSPTPVLPAATVVTPPPGPPEIGFHNAMAVRVGLLAALISVFLVICLSQIPELAAIVPYVTGGFVAVFIYKRRTGCALTMANGAKMGWITGVFAFTILTTLVTVMFLIASTQGGLVEIVRSSPEPHPPYVDQFIKSMEDPTEAASVIIGGLITSFVLLTILPTLGGAIGAKVFARER